MAAWEESFLLADTEEAMRWFGLVWAGSGLAVYHEGRGWGEHSAGLQALGIFQGRSHPRDFDEDLGWAIRVVTRLIRDELGGNIARVIQDKKKEVDGRSSGDTRDYRKQGQQAGNRPGSSGDHPGREEAKGSPDPWGGWKRGAQAAEDKPDRGWGWQERSYAERYPEEDRKPGDWGCPCGNNVFARFDVCGRCWRPRAEATYEVSLGEGQAWCLECRQVIHRGKEVCQCGGARSRDKPQARPRARAPTTGSSYRAGDAGAQQPPPLPMGAPTDMQDCVQWCRAILNPGGGVPHIASGWPQAPVRRISRTCLGDGFELVLPAVETSVVAQLWGLSQEQLTRALAEEKAGPEANAGPLFYLGATATAGSFLIHLMPNWVRDFEIWSDGKLGIDSRQIPGFPIPKEEKHVRFPLRLREAPRPVADWPAPSRQRGQRRDPWHEDEARGRTQQGQESGRDPWERRQGDPRGQEEELVGHGDARPPRRRVDSEAKDLDIPLGAVTTMPHSSATAKALAAAHYRLHHRAAGPNQYGWEPQQEDGRDAQGEARQQGSSAAPSGASGGGDSLHLARLQQEIHDQQQQLWSAREEIGRLQAQQREAEARSREAQMVQQGTPSPAKGPRQQLPDGDEQPGRLADRAPRPGAVSYMGITPPGSDSSRDGEGQLPDRGEPADQGEEEGVHRYGALGS